jgi:hypothetical protein
VLHTALDRRDGLAGIALVPKAVERFRSQAELDDKVTREVVRLGFTRFSRQRRRRAASSLPMMIRASEPPIYLPRGERGRVHFLSPDGASSRVPKLLYGMFNTGTRGGWGRIHR